MNQDSMDQVKLILERKGQKPVSVYHDPVDFKILLTAIELCEKDDWGGNGLNCSPIEITKRLFTTPEGIHITKTSGYMRVVRTMHRFEHDGIVKRVDSKKQHNIVVYTANYEALAIHFLEVIKPLLGSHNQQELSIKDNVYVSRFIHEMFNPYRPLKDIGDLIISIDDYMQRYVRLFFDTDKEEVRKLRQNKTKRGESAQLYSDFSEGGEVLDLDKEIEAGLRHLSNRKDKSSVEEYQFLLFIRQLLRFYNHSENTIPFAKDGIRISLHQFRKICQGKPLIDFLG